VTTLLFDTSVFICHLRGEDNHCTDYVQQVASRTLRGMISVVTVAELYAGEKITEDEEAVLDSLMKPFQVTDVDSEISMQAGRLVRQWRRSHGMGLLDAVIAATALTEGVPVLTLNAKHFYFIPGLVMINPVV
jgi:predicted nucleic acid-binding protein